jgi:hypothetical protein
MKITPCLMIIFAVAALLVFHGQAEMLDGTLGGVLDATCTIEKREISLSAAGLKFRLLRDRLRKSSRQFSVNRFTVTLTVTDSTMPPCSLCKISAGVEPFITLLRLSPKTEFTRERMRFF